MLETRDKILNAAETLARQRGYDGFSYADLEQIVGIRKASIHHHFARKADLAVAVMERYTERFQAQLNDIKARETLAAGQLMEYLAIYRSALAGGTQLCLCVVFGVATESLPQEVLDQLASFHRGSIDWLEELFERGMKDDSIASITEPRSEAVAALALVEGAMLLARAAGSTLPFDAGVKLLRDRASF